MSSESNDSSFALLWTFDTDLKAEQAKILLEEHGYFAHLNNSYSARFNEGVALMANVGINGGVRLFTKQSQAYDAYVLLAMHDFVPMKDIAPSSGGIEAFQRLMNRIPGMNSFGIIGQLIFLSFVITAIVLIISFI